MKEIKRVIYICLTTTLLISGVSYAATRIPTNKTIVYGRVATVSEGDAETSALYLAEDFYSVATPSESISSVATPSVATPSVATPSVATPSVATPSEPSEVLFEKEEPEEQDIPSWYTETKEYFSFIDRNGKKQNRVYGILNEAPAAEWFPCDAKGKLTCADAIDVNREDLDIAPFRYASIKVVDFDTIKNEFYQNVAFENLEKEILDSYLGQNYDGTCYDVWWFSEDLNNWDSPVDYWLYGYRVNSDQQELRWWLCNEQGQVVESNLVKAGKAIADTIIEGNWFFDSIFAYRGDLADPWNKGYPVSGVVGGRLIIRFRSSYWDSNNFPDITYGGSILVQYHRTDQDYAIKWKNSQINFYGDNIVIGKLPNLPQIVVSTAGTQECSLGGVSGYPMKYFYGNYIVTLVQHNHTWVVEQNISASCITQGSYKSYCSVCSERNDSSSPMLDHTWGTEYTRIEANCTTSGTISQTCERCNTTQDVDIIAPRGHEKPIDYDTTANDGTYFKKCIRCGIRMETQFNPYTVIYHGNGHTEGMMDVSCHIYGTIDLLSVNTFSKQYYTFNGWNTEVDGNGIKYEDGQDAYNLTTIYDGNVDLYAQWKQVSSLVTYKDWDGTVLKTQEVSLGEDAIPPNDPVRIGYTFASWNQKSENIQDHTTITAIYDINNYLLTIEGNGGVINNETEKKHFVDYDSSIDSLLILPTRVGYRFDGWYTSANNGNRYSDKGNKMPASELTVYAHWTPNKYQVTFNPNHIRWTSGSIVEQHTYDTKLGKLPVPELYGWTFEKWYTEPDGRGYAVSENTDTVADDITYYGNYTPIQYHINFCSSVGQKGTESVQEMNYLQVYDSFISDLPDIVEPGYTFAGWFDGDNKINEKTVFCPDRAAEEYTYYAKWDSNSYHITLKNGNEIIAELDKTYNTQIGILPEIAKPGYTFMGWYTNNNKKITSSSWVENKDTIYMAKWEANKYIVSFDKNLYAVEQNPADKTVIFDAVIGDLPILSANGYTFLGWFTQQEGGNKTEKNTAVELGDVTYYAHWENNTYSLKFITQNAMTSTKEIAVVYDNKIGSLPEPQLEDFAFNGWYKECFSDEYHEGILVDYASPSEASKIEENEVYRTASSSNAYAYFDLIFREEEGNKNLRGGKDLQLDTDDDNLYFNGQDRIPGTSDDCKIDLGLDKNIGTVDDFYLYKGFKVYPGPALMFGDLDDYMDLSNGFNLRPGEACLWDNDTNFIVSNGDDDKPGTKTDWVWDEELYTIRKPGEDGIFYTADDEIYWIGEDRIPVSDDDKLIYKGMDDKFGTNDDFIDNEDNTNTRPASDSKFGSADDEQWWNGPDKIPGNQDDCIINPGDDGAYGTEDDYYLNEDELKVFPGLDLIFGTEDDIIESHFSGVGSHNSPSATGQWKYIANLDNWKYSYMNGEEVVNCWKYLCYKDEWNWYRFDTKGYMQTGWFQDTENGLWYYLHNNADGKRGYMYTGRMQILDKWYYFSEKSDGYKGHLIFHE